MKKQKPRQSASGLPEIWRRLKKDKAAIISLFVLIAIIIVAIIAPLLAPYGYEVMDKKHPFDKPSKAHLLGTDRLGRDILSRLLYGSRYSLAMGFIATFISAFFGIILGSIAGYYGGVADRIICAVTDIAMAVPSLPLTLLLIAYLKSGVFSLVLAISITAWTGTARILRSRVRQICQLPYIQIEKTLGVKTPVILFRHVLPNLKDILLTRMALSVSGAMMTESGLSFLGLGTYGQKSWGNILHFAFFRNSILRGQVWWYLPPIICICIAVMGFMLVGYYGQQKKD